MFGDAARCIELASNEEETCLKTKNEVAKKEKERSEKLGWKSWEETCQVAINRSEWRTIAEALCATQAQIG